MTEFMEVLTFAARPPTLAEVLMIMAILGLVLWTRRTWHRMEERIDRCEDRHDQCTRDTLEFMEIGIEAISINRLAGDRDRRTPVKDSIDRVESKLRSKLHELKRRRGDI